MHNQTIINRRNLLQAARGERLERLDPLADTENAAATTLLAQRSDVAAQDIPAARTAARAVAAARRTAVSVVASCPVVPLDQYRQSAGASIDHRTQLPVEDARQ